MENEGMMPMAMVARVVAWVLDGSYCSAKYPLK